MFQMGFISDILFNSGNMYSRIFQKYLFWIWVPTLVKNHVDVCLYVSTESFTLETDLRK